MNPEYVGDSYDIVKRFFVRELRTLGYEVSIDPRFTGEWADAGESFFHLIQCRASEAQRASSNRQALLLDPDTGVRLRAGKRHVSFDHVRTEADRFTLVFAFDQAFSRKMKSREVIQNKLAALDDRGLAGLYFDSHARFLFASRDHQVIADLVTHLTAIGLPARRLITLAD